MRAQTCRTHFGIGFSPGYRRPGVASILRAGVQLDFCPETKDLSRRDYRTQPGVLTPGTDIKDVRPEIGGREVSALDAERDLLKSAYLSSNNPQPIFRRPFRAGPYCQCVLGLKPQAQSCSPFGTKNSIGSKYPSTFSKPHHPTFRARGRARARGRF